MRYHSHTIQLLGKPVPAGKPDALIIAGEKLGFRLPDSVREWYSEVDGQGILAKYSNEDEALSPSQFRRFDVCGKSLVTVLIENQGVCWWGFELNGSEDPAVYVNFDPPPDNIFKYASTFSEFTYVRVFDSMGWFDGEKFLLETKKPLQDATIQWLNNHYSKEPKSLGWPGTETYRFSCPLGRITIWQSESQADWALTADSPSSLALLKQQVSVVW